MESPEAYIPVDRCRAIARGQDLPDRTSGAALFADVSGFTPLTEALVQEHGPKRGAEEIARKLNKVYDALIAQVHGYGGSVISFSGDAITCWFEGDHGRRAMTCAFEMQQAMAQFAQEPMPLAVTESLSIKIALTAGPARRFVVGDSKIQLFDVLAGATLDQMARAEKQARKGEVIAGEEVIQHMSDEAQIAEWRIDPLTRRRFAVVSLVHDHNPVTLRPILPPSSLADEQTRPWLLPPVYEQLRARQGHFLAEILPAVALFLTFGEIDYDQDNAAGEKLDSFVRWVQDILARRGGYLIQLTNGYKGSYLYAAFGAPLAHGDDSATAVAAALELRSPPPRLDFITSVQIGLSRGRMWAGAYGSPTRCTYGVLGDAVNVAARLMEKAAPGQVLVTSRVADATSSLYHFQDLGTVAVRGRQNPVPTFVALGIRPPSPPSPSTPYKYPLVGRENELAQMEKVLEVALVGEGQILRVEGAAGIGKSHLVAEFTTRAASRGCRAAQSICQSTSRDIAYYPWRWIFRALFGLASEPSEGEQQAAWIARQVAQVEATVNNINPGLLLRLPLLGELLGLPIPDNATTAALNPEMRQQWLITLAVELIQTRARAQPLVLIIEDAHWMDEASLRLTQSLGWAMAQTPVVLILVQRPQDEPLLRDLSRLSYHHHLDLRELSPHGIEALVSDRLQGRPSALALALIQVRAQGNPFFTEELVHSLRELGGLIQENGTWTLSQAVFDTLRDAQCVVKDTTRGEWVLAPEARLSAVELGIPDSINGIVLSRIDRLPEAYRLTLKAASVIGRTFEFNLLARSHPNHPGSEVLLEQVKELQVRDLLRLEMSSHGLTCMFKHTITQEVTYDALPGDQQRELHLAVGGAMEQLLPEQVERLAYHYRCCEARDKAMFYLDKSARKAQHAFINETALSYYNQALELEQRWEWLKGKVQVLHVLGQRDEEQKELRTLETTPRTPAFEVAFLWGQYYEAMSNYPQAQANVERALAACQELSDVAGQVHSLNQLGAIAAREGKFDRAKDRYGQALDALGDAAQILIQTLNGLGIAECQQGQFAESKKHFEQALGLSRIYDNRFEQAQALNNLGMMAAYQRDFTSAQIYHREALEIRRAISYRAGEGLSLYNLAVAHVETGRYGEAEAYFKDALTIAQALGNRWDEVNILNGLGGLYLLLGDLPQAQTYLWQSLAVAQDIRDEAGEAYALGNLGQALRDAGDLPAAEKLLSEGMALAHAQGDPRAESLWLSHLSTVSLRAGQIEQAVAQANRTLTMRRHIHLELETTADLTTLASANLITGDISAALNYAEQAAAILDPHGGQGAEFPHRDYYVCYRVFFAAGQIERALAALLSAHKLVTDMADKITDTQLRESFLAIPLNREIASEYHKRRASD